MGSTLAKFVNYSENQEAEEDKTADDDSNSDPAAAGQSAAKHRLKMCSVRLERISSVDALAAAAATAGTASSTPSSSSAASAAAVEEKAMVLQVTKFPLDKAQDIVQRLGHGDRVRVVRSSSLLPSCTHLVVGSGAQVTKTEKLLSAVARGHVWIVSSKFLEEGDCKPGSECLFDLGSVPNPESWFRVPHRVTRMAAWSPDGDRGEGGPFGGWVVAVALRDKCRQEAYERILSFGGARVLDLFSPNHPLEGLTHVVSEPLLDSAGDAEGRRIWRVLAGLPRTVLIISFLYIGERLLKDNPPKAENFSVFRDIVQSIHRKFFNKSSSAPQEPAEDANPLTPLRKDSSLVLAPDASVLDTPSSSLKRQNSSSPVARSPSSKRPRLLHSPGGRWELRSLTKSPRKPVKRRSVLPELNGSLTGELLVRNDSLVSVSSQEEPADAEETLSRRSLPKTATVGEIKEAHLRGVCRRMAIYGADVADNLPAPRLVQQSDVDQGFDKDLDRFFGKIVEQASAHEKIRLDNDDDDGEEFDPSFEWLWMTSVLRGGLSTQWRLSPANFWTMMTDGILKQPHSAARHAVHELLTSMVVDFNPPQQDQAVEYYLKTLNCHGATDFNRQEPWEFVSSLLQQVKDDGVVDDSGAVLTIDLVSKILESNFNHWFEKTLLTGAFSLEFRPMLAKILWPGTDESPRVDTTIKTLLSTFAWACHSRIGTRLFKNLKLLVAMTAQYVCAAEKGCANGSKQELADRLAVDLVSVHENVDVARLCHSVSLVKPDWLALLTLTHLMRDELPEDITSSIRHLSLRTTLQAVNGKSLQAKKEANKEANKENRGDASRRKAAAKKMKKNQYGETPLHVACKKGNADAVRDILTSDDVAADVNARDNNGWTALHEACLAGSAECVEALLTTAAGGESPCVDVAAAGGDAGLTPLHEAADGGSAEAAHALLRIVAEAVDDRFGGLTAKDLCQKEDKEGKKPIDYAADPAVKQVLQFYHNHTAKPKRCITLAEMFAGEDSTPVIAPLALTPPASLCFKLIMDRYLSVFSVHYIKESLKTNNNEGEKRPRRFSQGLRGLPCPPEGNSVMSYDLTRADTVAARDLRTFNDLALLVKSPEVRGFSAEALSTIVIFSRR